MSKPLCIVSCPIDTYSGYGARSRDFVKSLIKIKGEEWDIKVLPQRWGETNWGFIENHKEKWGFWPEPMCRKDKRNINYAFKVVNGLKKYEPGDFSFIKNKINFTIFT